MRDSSKLSPAMVKDTVVSKPVEDLLNQQSSSNLSVDITVINGPLKGTSYQLKPNSHIVIGRSAEADIQIIDSGISRSHVNIRFDGNAVYVQDLKSVNGTYINARRFDRSIKIKNGDQISIGTTTVLKFSLHNALDERYRDYLDRQLTTDAVTGIYNRRAFTSYLNNNYLAAKDKNSSLTLMMIDVDHFKSFNDNYGHNVGDEILANIAEILKNNARTTDIVCRYGGDEFAVICPHINSLAALKMAEKIRTVTESTVLHIQGKVINTTLSIGIANFNRDKIETASELLAQADRAMYKAKSKGRNQIGFIAADN